MASKPKRANNAFQRLPVTMLICAVVIVLLSCVLTAKNTYILNDEDELGTSSALWDAGENAPEASDIGTQAYSVTVRAGGRESVLYAEKDETVEQVLTRLGIELGHGDAINAELTDRVYDGMTLELTLYPIGEPPALLGDAVSLAAIPFLPSSERFAGLNAALGAITEQMLVSGENAAQYLEDMENRRGENTVPITVVAENHSKESEDAKQEDDIGEDEEAVTAARIKAELSCGIYNPVNDPDAAHEYGAGITTFGEGGSYNGEQIWDFDDTEGYITTATGETVAYTNIIHVSATAYTTEKAYNRITATGTVARVGAIAVDPKVIPYGTRMYIVSEYGNWIYGYAVAEDCGGGIKGHKVDLFFDSIYECFQFGVRDAQIYILA